MTSVASICLRSTVSGLQQLARALDNDRAIPEPVRRMVYEDLNAAAADIARAAHRLELSARGVTPDTTDTADQP